MEPPELVKMPAPLSPLGHLKEFGRDPLQFLSTVARQSGDFVRLRFLNRRVYLLSAPEVIGSVLVKHPGEFRKSITYRTPLMRRMFDDGVFTSEGKLWTQQSELVRSWLLGDRTDRWFRLLSDESETLLQKWREGGNRDLNDDMQALTSKSFGRFLVDGIDQDELAGLIVACRSTREQFARQFSWQSILGNFLPNTAKRQHRQTMENLHARLQRTCPGRSFAELAAVHVLAKLLDRVEINLAGGHLVAPQASITLQPHLGIPASIRLRKPRTAIQD